MSSISEQPTTLATEIYIIDIKFSLCYYLFDIEIFFVPIFHETYRHNRLPVRQLSILKLMIIELTASNASAKSNRIEFIAFM